MPGLSHSVGWLVPPADRDPFISLTLSEKGALRDG